MTAKTNAQRQASLKAKRMEAGLIRLTLWAHPDDREALKVMISIRSGIRSGIQARAKAKQLEKS